MRKGIQGSDGKVRESALESSRCEDSAEEGSVVGDKPEAKHDTTAGGDHQDGHVLGDDDSERSSAADQLEEGRQGTTAAAFTPTAAAAMPPLTRLP
jgi:hypothetical protein